MAKPVGLGVSITSQDLKNAIKLGAQWRKRQQAMQRRIAWEAADRLQKDLKRRIQSTPETKDYRESLRVFQFGQDKSGFGIYSKSKRTTVKKLDLAVTIFVIKAKKVRRRTRRAVVVLEQFSPWTADMLPFMPSSKEAQVINQRVTRKEAAAVRKMRKKDRPKWRVALARAGAAQTPGTGIDPKAKTIQDTAFAGYRLEFGGGGLPPKPHWRPALRDFQTRGIKQIGQVSAIVSTLTDLNYKAWDHWKPTNVDILPERQTRDYLPFSQRVMAGNR